MTQPSGQETLHYAQSEGDAKRPTAEADRAAALDLDLSFPWISDVEQLTVEVRTRWILTDVNHIRTGARTMADIIFHIRERRHSRPPQWNIQASGGMWPAPSLPTSGPTPQMTKTGCIGGGTNEQPSASERL